MVSPDSRPGPSVCISSIDPSSLLILQRGNTAGSRATASLAHVKCLTDNNLLVIAKVVCRDFEVELHGAMISGVLNRHQEMLTGAGPFLILPEMS